MCLFSQLSAETICCILEFACSLIPAACLVERCIANSYEQEENGGAYVGGWQTTIVARHKHWRTWRYTMFKDVLTLPTASFNFGHKRATFLPLASYLARLCSESLDNGFSAYISTERAGSVSYASNSSDELVITWSPETGSERCIRIYGLNEGGTMSTRFPPGFYQHFQSLLKGDSCHADHHAFMHVTTMNNPDSLLAFRCISISGSLKYCSRMCLDSSHQALACDVNSIATLDSSMIPSL